MTRTRPIAALVSLLMLGGGLLVAVNAAVPKKRPEDDIKGQELWERSCWHCHGKGNGGDGPAAADLPVGVPNLQGTLKESEFEALIDTILYGKGAMPAFDAELDRHNARRILVYLKKLDDEESWPKAKRGGPQGDDEDEAAEGERGEDQPAEGEATEGEATEGDEAAPGDEAEAKEEAGPARVPSRAPLKPPKKLLPPPKPQKDD